MGYGIIQDHFTIPPDCTLQWRYKGRDSVSNHQPHQCLFNVLFRHRSMKTSKLCSTGLCAGNSPGTGEFPAQMASNAEKVPFDDVIMIYRIIGSRTDLSPAGHQATTQANADVLSLSTGLSKTNFNGIWIEIQNFRSTKCSWKSCMQNCGQFCSGPKVLKKKQISCTIY